MRPYARGVALENVSNARGVALENVFNARGVDRRPMRVRFYAVRSKRSLTLTGRIRRIRECCPTHEMWVIVTPALFDTRRARIYNARGFF